MRTYGLLLVGVMQLGSANVVLATEPPHHLTAPNVPTIPVAATEADTQVHLGKESSVQQRRSLRARTNAGLVGMISSAAEGADLGIVEDLGSMLETGPSRVRVLPIVGSEGSQNVQDILFARGVDVGIVQSDVLAHLKDDPPFSKLDKFLQYVAKLDEEEVHILAANEIHSIEDLAFKKVNFDAPGSGTSTTANLIFGELGIPVEATTWDQTQALEKLKRGEISALVYATGKPAPLFDAVKSTDNLHFLPIPTTDALRRTYREAALTADDYPELLNVGQSVDTLSVGTVLAVYNWTPGSERSNNVTHFVEALCSRWTELKEPTNHRTWHLDFSAEVPGWTRFAPAEECIRRAGSHPRATIAAQGASPSDPAHREALFKEFAEHIEADRKKEEGTVSAPPGPSWTNTKVAVTRR